MHSVIHKRALHRQFRATFGQLADGRIRGKFTELALFGKWIYSNVQSGEVIERIVVAFWIKGRAFPARIPTDRLGGMVLAIRIDFVFLAGRRRR